MKVDIGISGENRKGVVGVLNVILSDEYLLYTKCRNYHWNIVGSRFNELHKLFEEQYTKVSSIMDEVAERARTIGGHALGTVEEFCRFTRLKEHPGSYPNANVMVENLLHDHENLVRSLRNDIKTCEENYHDIGTGDFLTSLLKEHEKMAWFLRSYLEGENN